MSQSPTFKSWYGGFQTVWDNPMEIRIRQLYEWLQLGIKPWEYDHERYSGENSDMIGFFYNDDLENIKQIDELERRHKK